MNPPSSAAKKDRTSQKRMGILIALGAGIGAAIGAATDNLAVGVGVGVAVGVALGSSRGRKCGNPVEEDKPAA